MSADNWLVCPQCDDNKEAEENRMVNLLRKDYGKISAENYEERQREVKAFLREELEETLREDYDYQLDPATETLGVYYKCHCSVCSFGFEVHEDIDYLPLVNK